jgi:hypothetical protein
MENYLTMLVVADETNHRVLGFLLPVSRAK